MASGGEFRMNNSNRRQVPRPSSLSTSMISGSTPSSPLSSTTSTASSSAALSPVYAGSNSPYSPSPLSLSSMPGSFYLTSPPYGKREGLHEDMVSPGTAIGAAPLMGMTSEGTLALGTPTARSRRMVHLAKFGEYIQTPPMIQPRKPAWPLFNNKQGKASKLDDYNAHEEPPTQLDLILEYCLYPFTMPGKLFSFFKTQFFASFLVVAFISFLLFFVFAQISDPVQDGNNQEASSGVNIPHSYYPPPNYPHQNPNPRPEDLIQNEAEQRLMEERIQEALEKKFDEKFKKELAESLDRLDEKFGKRWEDKFNNIEEDLKLQIDNLERLKEQLTHLNLGTQEHESLRQKINDLQGKIEKLGDKKLIEARIAELRDDLTKLNGLIADSSSQAQLTESLKELENRITQVKAELTNQILNLRKPTPSRTDPQPNLTEDELREQIDAYLTTLFTFDDPSHPALNSLEQRMHDNIQNSLEKYANDEGKGVDFALISGGAYVIQHLTSKTFSQPASFLLYGLGKLLNYPPLYEPPETALTPGRMRGKCWPMDGNHGNLGIKLSQKIIPRNFTLEHASSEISLDLSSAPKLFVIKGYKDPFDFYEEPVILAQGTYIRDGEPGGSPLQTILVEPRIEEAFGGIQLSVLSNYGNEHFTCIYRFRVHGDIPL